MLNIRKFLSTVFINIALKEKTCEIQSYSFKNCKLIKKFQRIYDIDNKIEINKHLNFLINSHYFAYVSSLFTSIAQGILPSPNKADLEKFGIDSGAVNLKKIDNYYVYVSTTELKASQNILQDLKVDLIYSPFVILQKLIKNNGNLQQGRTLYVLKYSEFVAILISNKKEITFGNYFTLKANKDDNEDIELELEKADDDLIDSNLDVIDFEELDNIDNTSDDFEVNFEEPSDGLNTFEFDMMVFDYIKNTIKEYYNNSIYDNGFIDNLVIFEHENSSKAMHTYIEDELMIKPKIVKIDIFYEILQLSSNDLGVELEL